MQITILEWIANDMFRQFLVESMTKWIEKIMTMLVSNMKRNQRRSYNYNMSQQLYGHSQHCCLDKITRP